MSTIQWIPKSDEPKKWNDPVVAITVVAYQPQNETTAGPSDSKTHKTNHWCFYLETGPAKSVRAAKDYAYTHHAHKVIRMNNAKNLTIGSFFELIKAHGYDKYQFTNNGNGCRYWVFSVVNLLEEKGYLVKADEAKTALHTVWSGGKPITSGIQTSLDKQKGTFYR